MDQVDTSIKSLEELAKQYYKKDGQNQWPHIQRVKQQAERLAKWRNKPLTKEELAAVYFHDIGKAEAGNMDHGEWAATIAKPLLTDYLTPDQIETVITAIKAHNYDKPSPTPEADLLRSADANRPDLAWFLRKSYNKMKTQGMSHKEALDNAMRMAKKHVVTAAQLKNRPELYLKAFAKDIQKAEQAADKLSTRAEVARLIDLYNKKHPTESIYT